MGPEKQKDRRHVNKQLGKLPRIQLSSSRSSSSKYFLVEKKQTKILSQQWRLAKLHMIRGNINLCSQKWPQRKSTEGGRDLL